MNTKINLILDETIFTGDDESVFVDPVCKFFGIQKNHQLERIKKDRICQSDTRKNISELLFGDKRPRLSLGKRGFIRWIQMINPAKVRVDLQDLFVQYQVAVFDHLYNGNLNKRAQLEDLRQFALNINKALNLNREVKAYISEQNRYKKLCLESEPSEWAALKGSLREDQALPIDHLVKSVVLESYANKSIDELKKKRTALKDSVKKTNYRLLYQARKTQQKENPMPEGYKKEILKRKIANWEKQIIEIDSHLLGLNG